MLSVSPTGRLTGDRTGEYTDNDRHFRARGKDNFVLTYLDLPMTNTLRDDSRLLNNGASDSVTAWLDIDDPVAPVPVVTPDAAEVEAPPKSPSASSASPSSSSASSSSSSSSSSSGSESDEKEKKKKKKKHSKKSARVDPKELRALEKGARRVELLTKTPDVDMNRLFDPVRVDEERRALKLHGRLDKIPILTAMAGRIASQAESATGRPTRVHARVANGRIAQVVAGATAFDLMADIEGALTSSKKRKHASRKDKKSSGSGGSNTGEEDGSGVSLGSEDSADDVEKDEEDLSDIGSFIDSEDEMDEEGSDSAVVSHSSEGSDSGSDSDSGSSSDSSSSSSSDRKHKKHRKHGKKEKKHDGKKDKKHGKKHGKKDKKDKKDAKKKEEREKEREREKEKAKKAAKKEAHTRDAAAAAAAAADHAKKEHAKAASSPAGKEAPAKPVAAGLKKPLDISMFAPKKATTIIIAKPAVAAPAPPPVKPKAPAAAASASSFAVDTFLDQAMSFMASSDGEDDSVEESKKPVVLPSDKAAASTVKKAAAVVSLPPGSVNTKVGFSETYFSSVATLAVTKVAPLFVPPLEATYDLCGKHSVGLLKKIKLHEQRATNAGLAAAESDYAMIEMQTARHLAFTLVSLEPNAQNRLVHKAIDIACATDSGIRGPVPSMHTYPSNTMHRHFVDTLVAALCRTSAPNARAYSVMYAGMRAGKTPLARLACDLMHARNVTLLSKDRPLPAGLSTEYVCAVSGTVIAPGELVNLYRLTKRGTYESDGWTDPRPWETAQMRAHSYVFATRAVIASNKIALPFGEPVETPSVVVTPPPSAPGEEDEEEKEEKETNVIAPVVTAPVPAVKRPREDESTLVPEKPEKRQRLESVAPTAFEREMGNAPGDTVDTAEATRYVTLHPLKTTPYTGEKVLRIGPVYAALDKIRRGIFHNTAAAIMSAMGRIDHDPAKVRTAMAAMRGAQTPSQMDAALAKAGFTAIKSATGLTDFTPLDTIDHVPAKYRTAIAAMRVAQTPSQMAAALAKTGFDNDSVWAMVCLVHELVGDASEVQRGPPETAPNPFGDMFGIVSDTPAPDAVVSPIIDAPANTTVVLSVWGLLVFMAQSFFKNTAIISKREFQAVHDHVKAYCAGVCRGKSPLPNDYMVAMVLLIEAGLPLDI